MVVIPSMEFFVEFGYGGLFVAAFLAATILPLSSEVVLGALLLNGWSPTTLVAVATVGNVLGSVVNYGLGYWANTRAFKKWCKMSDDTLARAEKRFRTYGTWSLIFAWVPIIGDPLTVMAGMLRINLWWFFILVTTGKLLRYIVIAVLAAQVL